MFLVEFEHFILNVLLRERDFIKRQYVAFFLVRLTIQRQHTSSSRASERASERPGVRACVTALAREKMRMQLTSKRKKVNEYNQKKKKYDTYVLRSAGSMQTGSAACPCLFAHSRTYTPALDQ